MHSKRDYAESLVKWVSQIQSAIQTPFAANIQVIEVPMISHATRLSLACVAVLIASFAIPAKADFVVSIGSAVVAAGGSGSVDVFIEADGAPDDLQEFTLIFNLSSIVSLPGSALEFLDPQMEIHVQPGERDNYVFLGTSEAINGDIGTASVNGTQLTFFDESLDLNSDPIDVEVSTPKRIASIDFVHVVNPADAPLTNGDTYSIEGDDFASELYSAGAFDPSIVSFQNGLITVSAVPEPGSAAVLAMIACGLAFPRRRRK